MHCSRRFVAWPVASRPDLRKHRSRRFALASGLQRPCHVTSAPNDPGRLFVLEQETARIRVVMIDSEQVLTAPFLDLSAKVRYVPSEQGLLGLVFHPDYATNGFFYVNYTAQPDSATVVERYQVSAADPNVADATSAVTILGPIAQPGKNHNGGSMHFGPHDGYLYIGMGDGANGGCTSRDGTTLLGKMLRIDVDAGFPYAIPADNPFVGDPGVLGEIWSFGLRNPWRFSFDRETADMYIADVGFDLVEEIDFEPGTSPGGLDFEWPVMEGDICYNLPACLGTCNDPLTAAPIHAYAHTATCSAVTGGYVYRGCAIPDLQGTYFFADYCTFQVWSFRYDGTTMTEFQERTAELTPGSGLDLRWISSFGEDTDGELYVHRSMGRGAVQNRPRRGRARRRSRVWEMSEATAKYPVSASADFSTPATPPNSHWSPRRRKP